MLSDKCYLRFVMLGMGKLPTKFIMVLIFCLAVLNLPGCSNDKSSNLETRSVPHEAQWGIYALDISSQDISLLYSSDNEIANINLNSIGTHLAFSQKNQNSVELDTTSEIYVLNIADGVADKLTDNAYFDTYPSFSPDDSKIAFLSIRGGTLDLYVMDPNGTNQQLLYNSGGHDADVDWGSDGRIAFTRDYQIWSVNSNGMDAMQVTDPESAGIWGIANLPIGDYDPRFNPGANLIAFERMVDVSFLHGGYDIFVVSSDGSVETPLTHTGSSGYAQGFANWSHSGDRLVYVLSAVGTEGRYDLYMMEANGSENHNITPAYFPPIFLCRNGVFSLDDTQIYFIGQWWQ